VISGEENPARWDAGGRKNFLIILKNEEEWTNRRLACFDRMKSETKSYTAFACRGDLSYYVEGREYSEAKKSPN
jgi:hypothetical protein